MAIAATSGKIAAVHTTRGIIIRLTRLTDSSLIVHWFSEDHGLLKTVAKGARLFVKDRSPSSLESLTST